MRPYDRPYLLLTLTMLMWAGNAVASRLAVGEISPMVLTCLRWVLACAGLALVAGRAMLAERAALTGRWRTILAMGALGYTAFNALFYAAAHHTSAVNISILQGSIPVFVLVGAWLAYRTPIRPLQGVGVGVTLLGVVAVATGGDVSSLAALAFNRGDLFLLLACLLYAGYTLALRRRPAVSGPVFMSATALAALLTSVPLLLWEFSAGRAVWPGDRGLAILVYVSFLPSVLAQLFFMRAVELIGPGRAGVFANLVPVFGPVLAVLVLGEAFGPHHAVGLALVLGGIVVAERAGRPA